jgi:hypothetical protein
MSPPLPLFLKDDLNALRKRRETLLKRVEHMPKHSPGRYELLGQLKAVTAEAMKLENRLNGRSH